MSDIEKEFFEAMKIKPTMLCQCSFKNLKDYRYEYEYGDDNCEHSDDFEFSCKDCEKSIQNIPLYPPITSDIVLGLVCIINNFTDTIVILNGYDIEQIKKEVLNTCIKCKDIEFVKEEVQELFKKEESDG